MTTYKPLSRFVLTRGLSLTRKGDIGLHMTAEGYKIVMEYFRTHAYI